MILAVLDQIIDFQGPNLDYYLEQLRPSFSFIKIDLKTQMRFQIGFLPHNGLLFSDAASHKALSGCLSAVCRFFVDVVVCMYIFFKAGTFFLFRWF